MKGPGNILQKRGVHKFTTRKATRKASGTARLHGKNGYIHGR
jgi:hypothetical protein